MTYAFEEDKDGDSGSDESSAPAPLLPDGPSTAVLHMTRGTSDIWANFQWNVTSHELEKRRLSLGPGGWQFPRGTTNGHWYATHAHCVLLLCSG
jgi:hypothetical protein